MSDWIRKAITKKLKPELEQQGFYRYKPKDFVRVRGQIVENITFQVSSSGFKGFYLHYFTNLACDPDCDGIVSSYRIGDRLGYSEYDDISWKGDTEEKALIAMDSVINSINKDVIPFFESVGTIEKFTIALAGHYRTQFTDLDLLMCLMLCGEEGKAYETIKEMSDDSIENQYKDIILRLWSAMKAPGNDKLKRGCDLLEVLKNENLTTLGLQRLIT